MTPSGAAPVDILWSAIYSLGGPARDWHVNDLTGHALRYLADLQLMETLALTGPILEQGSAPCHLTALAKLTGHHVTGVDLNPERVAGLINYFGLDVRQCDIERTPLPFAAESFDTALLCETFEHLRIDPAFVVSEINRILRPGGTLVLATPNVYSLPSLLRYLTGRSVADPLQEFGKLRTSGQMGHVREYSATEVMRFLVASGFEIHSLGYRSHANRLGRKAFLLRLAYRIAPRRFRRELVIVAAKAQSVPPLAPLLPLDPDTRGNRQSE